jgi:hypothetical protein
MKNLTVFVNANALQKESQQADALASAAKQYHYEIENVSKTQ